MTRPRLARVLGIHPTARGFGWIVFEGPLAPYDWGAPPPKRDKLADSLTRVESLLEKHLPETLVLEAGRQGQLSQVAAAIAALAADRGVDVEVYPRDDVRACFRGFAAHSRHEIAQAVARQVEAIGDRLPKARRCWESEGRSMSLFSAAALVLTHYQLSAKRLLAELE